MSLPRLEDTPAGSSFTMWAAASAHGRLTQSGTIRAMAFADGSQAYGVLFNSAENLTASFGRIEVEAGEHAKGYRHRYALFLAAPIPWATTPASV